MFRDFAPKMDPCLGILLQKQAIFKKNFRKFFKKWTHVYFFHRDHDPGIMKFTNNDFMVLYSLNVKRVKKRVNANSLEKE